MGFASRQAPWSTIQVPLRTLYAAAADVRKEDALAAFDATTPSESGTAGSEADQADALAERETQRKKVATKAAKDPLRVVRQRVLQSARVSDGPPDPESLEAVGVSATGFMSPQVLAVSLVLAANAGELRDIQAKTPEAARRAADATREVVEKNKAF